MRLLGHYVTHLKKVGGGPKCATLPSCAHACCRLHVQTSLAGYALITAGPVRGAVVAYCLACPCLLKGKLR